MTLAALQAWIVAHPAECVALALVVLSLANAALKGKPTSLLGRIVDRLSALTRADAKGTLSWPLIGRSIFEAVTAKPEPTAPPAPIEPDGARTQVMRAVGDSDRGVRGFASRAALLDLAALAVAGAALAFTATALSGCPLPAPDGCTPLDTRCSPEGVPQSCSPTQRWTSGAMQRPCAERAEGAVCCRARSPYGGGRELHACVPAAACLPETSADAGAEGGDQ